MFVFRYVTIFPSFFYNYFQLSLANKSLKRGIIDYQVFNLRDYADKGKVDDYPYGGGRGMLLKIDPIVEVINIIKAGCLNSYIVLLSPQGERLTQKDVFRLANSNNNITFICGHYEGIDARIQNYVDEQISVGDFVTMGGEIPALLVTDAMIRAIPGVIKEESYKQDSFTNGNMFDFDSYTRPPVFQRLSVPIVLLSGDHRKIEEWKQQNMKEKREMLKNHGK